MKKFIFALSFITLTANASSYLAYEIADPSGEMEVLNIGAAASGSSLLGSTTGIFNPAAGLVIIADGEASLNLDKTLIQQKVEEIQMAIEFGDELTEQQEAILTVGFDAGQLDENGNIVTE